MVVGFTRPPVLVGTSWIGPTIAGLIVNVWGAEEALNVSIVGETLPPKKLMVIVPEYIPLGTTVNFPDIVLTAPDAGPVRL